MTGSLALGRHSAHLLLLAVSILVLTGIVMLVSTGVYHAGTRPEDLYFDVKRQLLWAGMGLALGGAMAAIDYRIWGRRAWWGYGVALILLVLCFVPGIGLEINGERRWIDLGVRFQPSEFAKPVLLVVVAAWYAQWRDEADRFWNGFAAPGILAVSLMALVALQVDIGTTFVMAAAVFATMWVAGAKRGYLAGALGLATAAFAALVVVVPGRMTRVLAVLRPEDYEQGVGLQQKVAKMAFGTGGVEGVGLGAGRMKMQYLPFAHTDFIFPMIGEELGLLACLGVVLCYVSILIAGLVIALRAPDRFGRLLATGLTMIVVVQALLNMAVTTAVFPNTGLPLPFVSYGGSNLIASMMATGVLLNIYWSGVRGRRLRCEADGNL